MLSVILSIILACSSEDAKPKENSDFSQDLERARSIFGTIDSLKGLEPDKKVLELGKALYSERALSGNGKQSCEDCHLLDRSGSEPLRVSVGAYGKPVHRNAPTTFNSKYHISQFWDGRAKDLKEQAGGPILAAGEMGSNSKEDVVKAISSIEKYPKMFEESFETKDITFDKITYSIAEFEKTLVTKDRFDDWMNGVGTLTQDEIDGMNKFIEVGCVSCHNGPLLGANSYQKMGVLEPYRLDPEHIDLGRYNVTANDSDKEVFKVPSLRNVTNTSPYFHDGMAFTIEEAVKVMGKIQLGKNLEDQEIKSIVTFLKTMENTNNF